MSRLEQAARETRLASARFGLALAVASMVVYGVGGDEIRDVMTFTVLLAVLIGQSQVLGLMGPWRSELEKGS